VRDRIARAAERAGRAPDAVGLVAVTKTGPAERAAALVEMGQLDLGENYPQELWRKAEALAGTPARWHLIGHLQSNKAARSLPLLKAIHGVDSLRLLTFLDDLAARTELADPPALFLQVNASEEPSKHGWTVAGLLEDAPAIARLSSRLPIVGLMTMAAYDDDPESARPTFVRLRQAREELRQRTGLALPELSMGMSNDFEVAIEEGATSVRVGTALFEGLNP
jgi:pyridoxal phosphate enzyme (YggS family)